MNAPRPAGMNGKGLSAVNPACCVGSEISACFPWMQIPAFPFARAGGVETLAFQLLQLHEESFRVAKFRIGPPLSSGPTPAKQSAFCSAGRLGLSTGEGGTNYRKVLLLLKGG